ncbi:MAG: CDP-alcohol phosphatidyltransferase family protein [Actinomycetota bacterium]|nr:CDP-alcohol phosphatidyltransferase family protein [Actinomycetota bacterium]
MFDGRFRTGVDRATKPIGTALRRTGLSPDHLTALGLILAVPTAIVIASGHLWIGLVLLVASAVPDLLDGALAKASGRSSVRGAFFDSVADRVTDGLVLSGVAWYLQSRHHGHLFLLPMAVLAASLLISYERAKAESLGFDAKGGLMERAERVIVLCVGLLLGFLLVPLLWVMLALTLVTAGQRFVKVWRQATVAGVAASAEQGRSVPESVVVTQAAEPATVAPAPELPSQVGERGDASATRWRAWREANGLAARPGRFTHGTRRRAEGVTWRERRQARVEDRPVARSGPRRRQSGSRRP